MTLEEIYQNTFYNSVTPNVKEVLDEITLFDFKRDRNGKVQTFYFYFKQKEKEYVLQHTFLYHSSGVDNWFKIKRPFLTPKPFSLNKTELKFLSDELMRAVNKWNSLIYN